MKLTASQAGVVEIMKCGFSVFAQRRPNPKFWKAECDHLPRISISTLNALVFRGMLTYDEDDTLRTYELTDKALGLTR